MRGVCRRALIVAAAGSLAGLFASAGATQVPAQVPVSVPAKVRANVPVPRLRLAFRPCSTPGLTCSS